MDVCCLRYSPTLDLWKKSMKKACKVYVDFNTLNTPHKQETGAHSIYSINYERYTCPQTIIIFTFFIVYPVCNMSKEHILLQTLRFFYFSIPT